MKNKTLGSIIKEFKEVNKLSNKDIGDMVGVHNSMVSRWSNDQWIPYGENRSRLADLLDISMAYMNELCGEIPSPKMDEEPTTINDIRGITKNDFRDIAYKYNIDSGLFFAVLEHDAKFLKIDCINSGILPRELVSMVLNDLHAGPNVIEEVMRLYFEDDSVKYLARLVEEYETARASILDHLNAIGRELAEIDPIIDSIKAEAINNSPKVTPSKKEFKFTPNKAVKMTYDSDDDYISAILNKIKTLGALDHQKKDTKLRLKELYDYLKKNYGIVLEQEKKEYRRRTGIDEDVKVSSLRALCSNPTYREIAISVLNGWIQAAEKEQKNV